MVKITNLHHRKLKWRMINLSVGGKCSNEYLSLQEFCSVASAKARKKSTKFDAKANKVDFSLKPMLISSLQTFSRLINLMKHI